MPNHKLDITGQQFGNFVAIERGDCVDGKYKWKFRCICGAIVQARVSAMRSGKRVSCGCLGHPGKRMPTVPYEEHTIYRAWIAIRQRCYNTKHPNYHQYGGRGIIMDTKWRFNYQSFRDYIVNTIGYRPEGCVIDRIDNNGNYTSRNLRWATPTESSNNRRFHGITPAK